MNNLEQLQAIATLIKQEFDGFVTWDATLVVKDEYDFEIARLYGASCNLYPPGKEVYLLNNDGEWYELGEGDRNFEYVADSVMDRLQNLRILKHVRIKSELWKR